MAPTLLTRDECNAAINAFLDQHMGMVHRDDVGPLFGQLACMCTQSLPDPTIQRYWGDAVSVALAGDRRISGARHESPAAAFATAASSRMTSAMSCW
jgi:hypothetical protein